jgi:DNA-binding NarL/FixJ family response regulator
MPLTVMIADDDALARALIEAIVERDGGLVLVGSAEDAARAIELAGEHRPDVAVLDWLMPGGGGEVAAREILERSPETSIVALTSGTREAAADTLRAGALHAVVKGSPPQELLRTIRAAAAAGAGTDTGTGDS